MTTSPAVSTNKVITFIVFVIAAILTSLFVYRASHPTIATHLSAEAGTLFDVPRDIKPFTLQQANNQKFTEKNLQNHWTVLVFGFAHCSSVCPTTLSMLKRVYEKLPANHENVQVVMVSLDPARDTPATLADYTHSYDASFTGITGNIQDVRKLQSQFGIYSANDGNASQNYQIQHTASIMLVNPKGQWAGLLRFGLNPQQFAQALNAAMQTA